MISIRREDTLWERLRRDPRPIILYGTGNGADKIIDQLAEIGRTPDGVFASSGFVRNRTFRGMPVQSYEEILARFGDDIVILISFGSTLPDVIGQMYALSEKHDTVLPDVPLIGGEVFTYEYYLAHEKEITDTCSLLADEQSRLLFEDMLRYRLTGKLSFLTRTEDAGVSLQTLADTAKIRTAVDGGAFKGDTAEMIRKACPNVTEIIAVEADARTVKKLTEYAETTGGTVRPVHAALWDIPDTLTYSASASRGAGADGTNKRAKTVEVPADTVDRIVGEMHVDLIKLDVEGAEARALAGADGVISRDMPILSVSLYHRTEDLFSLPLSIAAKYDGYRFYLRRVPCIPAWDLMLYAVPARFCKN